jgi:PAS domain S-box-containing protein
MTDTIRVLHVDDDPDFMAVTRDLLEHEDQRFEVVTDTSARDGLARLADEPVDCVVSDYEMPGMDGLEFLEAVRADRPDLPFVLFTGKGSEEIASAAISSGVTDYLQKDPSTDQYAVLGNRIANAVISYRRDRQLEAEQRRFSTLFEKLTQPAVEVEYDGMEPVVKRVNEAFEDVFGYDEATMAGDSLDDHIVPDGREPGAIDINRRVRAGEGLFSREVTRQTATGPRDFLLYNAAYDDGSGGFAIYTDITDRRARERKLERLQERTQALMATNTVKETAQVAVEIAHEVLDAELSGFHRLTDDDRRFELLTVTDPLCEEFESLPSYERDAESNPAAAVVWEVYERGEPRFLDDIREHDRLAGNTPAGSAIIYPIHDHGVFIVSATEPAAFDETDKALMDVLVSTLTAALQRVEREVLLRERERELARQNDRLEEFASVVSHDLRNPLNVAIGQLELVRAERESEHLDAVAQAHDRMGKLIDDTLTLARHGETVADVESASLRELAEGCWQTVGTADATLAVETDTTIRADRSRVRQLVENLFRNAIDHGGPTVQVTVGDLDDSTGFYVADDGPGIPPAERDRVFESGYSTRDDGTGFGLAIVEEIAEAHGWTVRATDAADGGARFEVTDVDSNETSVN